MEWHDTGLVLGFRRLGESDVILDCLTAHHGRHAGLVRGGRGKRLAATVQPGNSVALTWRARIEEHLGTYRVEPLRIRAGAALDDAAALDALGVLAFLCTLLPEREPHPAVFAAAEVVVDTLGDALSAAALLARFELAILSELGFRLDLSACAATGETEDLIYVSPKSGRAVSRAAGAPYAPRLLPLPSILLGAPAANDPDAIARQIEQGFALTGYFLERDVTGPRALVLPPARARIIERLRKVA